eukprot:2071712-Rhodomonas_salina.2
MKAKCIYLVASKKDSRVQRRAGGSAEWQTEIRVLSRQAGRKSTGRRGALRLHARRSFSRGPT